MSTYELGHQPLSLASAAASLVAAGHQVRCADVAVGTLSAEDVDWAEGAALSVPMHTAMRLALRVAGALRARRPALPLCFFGLYVGMAGDVEGTRRPPPSSPVSSSPGWWRGRTAPPRGPPSSWAVVTPGCPSAGCSPA